eukprot:6177822-Pleurochrysis_carterae.AAC.1
MSRSSAHQARYGAADAGHDSSTAPHRARSPPPRVTRGISRPPAPLADVHCAALHRTGTSRTPVYFPIFDA